MYLSLIQNLDFKIWIMPIKYNAFTKDIYLLEKKQYLHIYNAKFSICCIL